MGKVKFGKSVEKKLEEGEDEKIFKYSPGTLAVASGGAWAFSAYAAQLGVAEGNAYRIAAASLKKISDQIATPLAELLESPIKLITISQTGLSFESFLSIAYESPFTIADWANFLQLPENELVSFQEESKPFNQAQSEIILQITQLQKLAEEILGTQERFAIWAITPSLALEGKRPKDFFGSTFGIQMLTTELHRIEYGILA